MSVTLQARFTDMLSRQGIALQRDKGMVHCLFHGPERTPSLHIDLERGLFHCFGCGVGGGVKKFAELVGEPWKGSLINSRATFVRRARFVAEQRACQILRRRRDERLDALFAELREYWRDAAVAADLLAFFHRRPDLAEEFSALAAHTEREYGNLASKLAVLEAQLDEVVA